MRFDKTFLGATAIFVTLAALGACSSGGDADPNDANVDGDGGPSDKTAPTFAGIVSATATTENDVALTWEAATDDVTPKERIAYHVYVSTTDGGHDFKAPWATTPAGAIGTTIGGLQSGTTYWIVVRAIDEAGNEDGNTVAKQVTTQDVTAPKFGGVTEVKGSDKDALSVAWNPATDAGTKAAGIKYRVFVADKAGAYDFTKPALETAAGAASATVTGLEEAKTYFVVVRAVDAAGNVDGNVKEKSDRTLDKTAPKFDGVQKTSVLGTSIKLLWNDAKDNFDPAPYLTYQVFQAKTAGGYDFTKPVATTAPGITEYTATGLDVSTTYFYVVRAKDSAGNVDENKVELSAKTAASADITAPVFGGIVSATGTGARTINLTWTAATDDTSTKDGIFYDIYTATAPGAFDYTSPSASTLGGATSYVVGGLPPLTTYYFAVRARDEAGNRDTNVVSKAGTTLADTTPPTFGGLTTVKALGPTGLQLSWSSATDDVSPSSAIKYQVFMGTAAGGVNLSAPIGTTSAGVTSFSVSGLAQNTKYFFIVRAVDEVGNVDANKIEVAGVTDPDKTPPTFAGLSTVTPQSPTSLLLSWKAATDDVTASTGIVYDIYAAASAAAISYTTPTYTTGAGALSYTVTGLSPNQTVYYVVRARDAVGNRDTNTTVVPGTTLKDTTAPGAPFVGAASVSGASATSLTVNWAAATDDVTPSGSIVYSICYSTVPTGCSDASWGVAGTSTVVTTTGATSRAFTGLSPVTDYYFRVWAQDAAGNVNKATAVVSGKTVTDTTAPTWPLTSGCKTAAAAAPPGPGAGAAAVDLTWDAAADNVSSAGQLVYDIYRSTTAGVIPASPTYTTSPGVTSYRATGLSPSTTYYWTCRARDVAGNRDANTKQVTGATTADTTAPFMPAGTAYTGAASATALGVSSIQVTWPTANDNVTATGSINYLICYSTSSTGCTTSFSANGGVSVGGTSTTIGGLTPYTFYYVVVRARDAALNVDTNTTVRSVRTDQDVTAPAVSGSVSVSPVYSSGLASAQRLTASWSAASDISGVFYRICYGTAVTTNYSSCTGAGGSTTTSGTNSVTLNGLATNTRYYVSVVACDYASPTSNCEAYTNSHYGTAKTAVSYSSDIYPDIFNSNCNVGGCKNCHSWTRVATYNVASGVACASKYVQPGGATSTSSLYLRMSGSTCAGGQMPPTYAPYNAAPYSCVVYPSKITMMSDWIGQGANDN